MIINIIGHGLQRGEIIGQQYQEHVIGIPVAQHFNSVSFYCNAGDGFNGTNAHSIVNGEWHDLVQEINDVHQIPEHFVFPNQEAWNDILPRDPDNQWKHIPPGPNDPHYVPPNVVHQNDDIEILRLRQILVPERIPQSQLVISPTNNTCISLSWLINNIPLIIDAHQPLADLFDNDNYTYRWLVCRDWITELDPHNNQESLARINEATKQYGEMDRLLWEQ